MFELKFDMKYSVDMVFVFGHLSKIVMPIYGR